MLSGYSNLEKEKKKIKKPRRPIETFGFQLRSNSTILSGFQAHKTSSIFSFFYMQQKKHNSIKQEKKIDATMKWKKKHTKMISHTALVSLWIKNK